MQVGADRGEDTWTKGGGVREVLANEERNAECFVIGRRIE